MATANPIRSQSRVSSDRSGSCSDDVVSLDSWSEKLDASNDWPAEFVSEPNRSRLSSAGSGRPGLSHQLAGRQPSLSDVPKEKSVLLRSGPPDSNPNAIARGRTGAIPTISGHVQNRDLGVPSLPRRPSSSTSSDSDSSPLHSPRHSMQEHSPQSPSRRIPQTGSHISGGHHFQFAHHLHPHYNSSPVHQGSAGQLASHSSGRTHSPHNHNFGGHVHHGSDSPHSQSHHRGMPYYATSSSSSQYAHHNSYHPGNAAIDQIIEREGEKLKTKMKSMWNNVKYGEKLMLNVYYFIIFVCSLLIT